MINSWYFIYLFHRFSWAERRANVFAQFDLGKFDKMKNILFFHMFSHFLSIFFCLFIHLLISFYRSSWAKRKKCSCRHFELWDRVQPCSNKIQNRNRVHYLVQIKHTLKKGFQNCQWISQRIFEIDQFWSQFVIM